jgi:hypothetical protein
MFHEEPLPPDVIEMESKRARRKKGRKEKTMEREFGAEIARTFGARLRRMYEQDEQGLPIEMAESLERLKCAENNAAPAVRASGSKRDDGGLVSFLSRIVPTPR